MTGQDIRDFKVKHNLTQKQLAERLNTTQQLISAYEQEKKEIPGIFATALCMYAENKRLSAENVRLDIKNIECEATLQAINDFHSKRISPSRLILIFGTISLVVIAILFWR